MKARVAGACIDNDEVADAHACYVCAQRHVRQIVHHAAVVLGCEQAQLGLGVGLLLVLLVLLVLIVLVLLLLVLGLDRA